jgi:hypothetical protein
MESLLDLQCVEADAECLAFLGVRWLLMIDEPSDGHIKVSDSLNPDSVPLEFLR